MHTELSIDIDLTFKLLFTDHNTYTYDSSSIISF